jgi:23S rRNA pseudouridine2605 synthase
MARKSDTQDQDGDRVAKIMARAGLCSRREAESWIEAGRVQVNGKVITSPALDIGPADKVVVDGRPLPERERTRLFLYHKPRGLVTTNSDPQGRPTIFDALPPNLPRLISVGRLDLNSEGLLLLTNDGSLARALELPSTGWLRRYRARALGHVNQSTLDRIKNGITVEGVRYGPIEATIDREQGANTWLTVGIREGKNREVRNVLGALGLKVNRLIRVSFGPFELDILREGGVAEIPTRELRSALGEHVLKEADVDLTGPTSDWETPRAARFPNIDSRGRERSGPERAERPARTSRPRDDAPRDRRERPERSERPERKFGDRNRDDRTDPNKRFGDRAPREPLKGNEAVIGGERVPVKRRIMKHHSDTHAWRGGDKPLRRKYRGAPHELETPVSAKKSEIVADRKGRQVQVERYGEKKPEVVEERRPARGRFGDRPNKGRSDGRPPRRDDKRGNADAPRRDARRDESKLPRRDDSRGERKFDRRDDRPQEAERPARPRQRRSFDRKAGPRPSRPRPRD